MGSQDVHLLDLIVNDHDEASDDSVDDGHCRVADPSRRPSPGRVVSPDVDQRLRDKVEVAVLPTEMPDLGDIACIRGPLEERMRLRVVTGETRSALDGAARTADRDESEDEATSPWSGTQGGAERAGRQARRHALVGRHAEESLTSSSHRAHAGRVA